MFVSHVSTCPGNACRGSAHGAALLWCSKNPGVARGKAWHHSGQKTDEQQKYGRKVWTNSEGILLDELFFNDMKAPIYDSFKKHSENLLAKIQFFIPVRLSQMKISSNICIIIVHEHHVPRQNTLEFITACNFAVAHTVLLGSRGDNKSSWPSACK